MESCHELGISAALEIFRSSNGSLAWENRQRGCRSMGCEGNDVEMQEAQESAMETM